MQFAVTPKCSLPFSAKAVRWISKLFGGIRTCLRIVGSVTIVWLTTEVDDQSSLHCVIVSTDIMSDDIGRRDASRGGECSKTSS